MTRPNRRALLILAVAGVVLGVFLYFELTSGAGPQPAEEPAFIAEAEPGDPGSGDHTCAYFFAVLQQVAHDSLSVRTGEFKSLYDGNDVQGCEVSFVAHDSLPVAAPLPDFDALPESEMYRLGWRMSEGIGADGPGSGMFGIEKETVRCIVRWAQPAHLADDGEIVQSETFRLTVQCRSDADHLPARSPTP
jgi:hypothetical protein